MNRWACILQRVSRVWICSHQTLESITIKTRKVSLQILNSAERTPDITFWWVRKWWTKNSSISLRTFLRIERHRWGRALCKRVETRWWTSLSLSRTKIFRQIVGVALWRTTVWSFPHPSRMMRWTKVKFLWKRVGRIWPMISSSSSKDTPIKPIKQNSSKWSNRTNIIWKGKIMQPGETKSRRLDATTSIVKLAPRSQYTKRTNSFKCSVDVIHPIHPHRGQARCTSYRDKRRLTRNSSEGGQLRWMRGDGP